MSSSADVALAPSRKISSSADERSPLYNDNLLLGDESSEGQTNPHNDDPGHHDGQDSPEVTSRDGEREPSQIKNGDELGQARANEDPTDQAPPKPEDGDQAPLEQEDGGQGCHKGDGDKLTIQTDGDGTTEDEENKNL